MADTANNGQVVELEALQKYARELKDKNRYVGRLAYGERAWISGASAAVKPARKRRVGGASKGAAARTNMMTKSEKEMLDLVIAMKTHNEEALRDWEQDNHVSFAR